MPGTGGTHFLRVCLLASGSRGNSLYIESAESRVLIDAGLSAKEIAARLSTIGVNAEDLDAVFLTHEHIDHSRGIGPLARRYDLPVFMHHQARQALPKLGRVDDLREIDSGEAFVFRDLQISPFSLTHDAVAPLGFVVEMREGKVGLVTDLGIATRLVADCLQGCRMLVLEANHDEEMLRDGPYPWPVKQRIRSNHGHLSNAAAAELLGGLLWEGLEAVFLAHLSEENNCPDLVLECMRRSMVGQNLCLPRLLVGQQNRVSDHVVG